MRLGKVLPAPDSAIARLARENGPRLMEQAIKALVTGALVQDAVTDDADGKPETPKPPRKPSVGQRLASAALLRVATKSVPGALLVGGGLLAKAVYDREQARRAAGVPRRQR